MDIRELQQNEFADLFPEASAQQPAKQGFTAGEDPIVDLFASTTETTTVPGSTSDSTTETTTIALEGDNNADIFDQGDQAQTKPGRKPKYDFSDAKGYFEDRFKTGKFVPIEEEAEDGSKKLFIPSTPEEFDEVIDLQVNYRLDQQKKELEQNWYQGKSPAWQAVAKFAEMVDDPAEVLPFIQGVQTIQSVAEVDENSIDGAERIVRIRLTQRGEPQDVIEEQIDSLKTTDRLISTAAKYKPMIVNQEKQQLQQMQYKKAQEEREYLQLVESIRESAIKAIETPLFGKQKLKQEEKAIVYELIAQPNEEQGGYPIYSEIDKLFENKDFETLKQIALLLRKKEEFLGYLSASAADKTAEGLQRKLRVAGDSRNSSSNDYVPDDSRPAVKRTQYGPPKFGRI